MPPQPFVSVHDEDVATPASWPRATHAPRPTIIEPPGGWAPLNLRELWEHRELVFFLTWRDVKVRYKQTVLGIAWAVLQPVTTMVVFSIFFGRLGGIPSDGLPYPLFALAALVPWTFFAHGLSQASNSVVGSQHLVTKVYFPRLSIPLASVLSGVVDFAIAFGVLMAVMLWYGYPPTPRALWIVPLFVLALATSLGAALWLAALNVKYRDVRHAVPFLTQVWLFATPIAYPSSLLEGAWRTLYALNPMAGVVEGFRWALLDTGTAPYAMLAASSLMALAALVPGALYFRRTEAAFADVI